MDDRLWRIVGSLLLLGCTSKRGLDSGHDGASVGRGALVAERRLRVELRLVEGRVRVGAFDGAQPVMTDLWLYTLRGGARTPFSGFVDPPARRRSRRLLLPCRLGDAPSGLTPCDQGEENGVMTDGIREWLTAGKRRSAINGTTTFALQQPLREPLLVVAAVEDERYAGAAAMNPDGSVAAVPAGLGAPGAHRRVSYEDVAPLLKQCQACHAPGGAAQYFPLRSYEDIVNHDYGSEEDRRACAVQHADDAAARTACEQAISESEYMVEPGAPALSPLLHRTRPDEQRSVSALGLRWYGAGGERRFADKGDRRMPPQNLTADPADDQPTPNYFDGRPADYQLLFDWVAQGAPR